jgi:L-alanine-DL-glutamate epimerase-like enolase superfamily enzyme
MLGGQVRDKIRAYAWIGAIVPTMSPPPPAHAASRASPRSR